MNPYKYFGRQTMEQIAESIRPKEQNFLSKEQLEELNKRTYDAQLPITTEVKTKTPPSSMIVEVIEEGDEKEEEPPSTDFHWLNRISDKVELIDLE